MSFDQRKKDHLKLSLDLKNQTSFNPEDFIELQHDPLNDLNLDEVSIEKKLFSKTLKAPFYVSPMTAGHLESLEINEAFAEICEKRSWLLGLGSQRGQLMDLKKAKEFSLIKKKYPKVLLMGNIGLSQLIQMKKSELEYLINSLKDPLCFSVHTNTLQEALQEEGTPYFKSCLKVLKDFSSSFKIPFILKEVGCGFSYNSLKKLKKIPIKAVDLSGFGGTHWGRIETMRSKDEFSKELGEAFSNWGISTLQSLMNAKKAKLKSSLWASGGIRSGVQACIYLSLGADMVGFAYPLLEALKKGGKKSLDFKMKVLEKQLQISMFCTGIKSLKDFKKKKVWMTRQFIKN